MLNGALCEDELEEAKSMSLPVLPSRPCIPPGWILDLPENLILVCLGLSTSLASPSFLARTIISASSRFVQTYSVSSNSDPSSEPSSVQLASASETPLATSSKSPLAPSSESLPRDISHLLGGDSESQGDRERHTERGG